MAYFLASLVLSGVGPTVHAQEPTPPTGFRAIFNGKDLTGWYGLDPHRAAPLKGEKKEADLKQ
jgi:hypothetical protein